MSIQGALWELCNVAGELADRTSEETLKDMGFTETFINTMICKLENAQNEYFERLEGSTSI